MQSLAANGVVITRDGDVLLITFRGVLTKQTLRCGRDLVLKEAQRRPIKALVVDLRWTVRLMTSDEWGDVADASAKMDRQIRVGSTALVVTPAMLDEVERQCVRIEAKGVTWVPFLELSAALSWAESRRVAAHSWWAPHL